MTFAYILLGIVVLIVLWAVFAYNRFIALTNRVKEAWSDIDVQFKRRYDLIPNLVETVKGYATHEKTTLEQLTAARTQAINAQGSPDRAKAEDALSGALKTVFAVSENYPNLKANENFLELQRELSDTENKIQAARRFYNSVVQDLNVSIQSFPNNVIAGWFGFKMSEYFQLSEADAAAKEPVKVSF
jgi:LemA protein